MEKITYAISDVRIRDAAPADYEEILRQNEESVQFLSPMDADRLKKLKSESELLWVAEIERAEGEPIIGAFIIAFREGADYDSVNYQWFENHFDNFLYVDRVVVDIPARGGGLGNLIYDAVFEYAKANDIERVTAEIDIEPANPVSLVFHEKYGFEEVGRQEVAGGTKVVSLQASSGA